MRNFIKNFVSPEINEVDSHVAAHYLVHVEKFKPVLEQIRMNNLGLTSEGQFRMSGPISCTNLIVSIRKALLLILL